MNYAPRYGRYPIPYSCPPPLRSVKIGLNRKIPISKLDFPFLKGIIVIYGNLSDRNTISQAIKSP